MFQSASGQVACLSCPERTFGPVAGLSVCIECPAQVSADRHNCSWVSCPANHMYQQGINACAMCSLGSSAPAGVAAVCVQCVPGYYTPEQGEDCVSCTQPGMEGLQCFNGLARVQEGYWAYTVPTPVTSAAATDSAVTQELLVFRTATCPTDFCAGGALQVGGEQNRSTEASLLAAQCAYPRVNSPLCGSCAEGFIPWAAECARCSGPDVAAIIGLILLSFALVFIFLLSDRSSAGFLDILLYFTQTAMLIVGPPAGFLRFLGFANLSSNSLSTCIADISPYGQVAFNVLMPWILIAELGVIGALHTLVYRLVQWQRRGLLPSSTLLARLQSIGAVNLNSYLACALVIFCFSYTQVSSSSIAYLTCADVGPTRVVFSMPSIDCDDQQYANYKAVVLLMLLLLIVGLPIGSLAFLYTKRKAIQAATELLQAKARAELAVLSPQQPPPEGKELGEALPRAESESVSDASVVLEQSACARGGPEQQQQHQQQQLKTDAATLLVRWGPMFAAYHSGAWWWFSATLLRRAVFTTVQVTLVAYPRPRYFVFTVLNLLTLSVHTQLQPFTTLALNRAELASQATLVLLCSLLTAYPPPYSTPVQIVLVLLIAPLTLVLSLLFVRGVRPLLLTTLRTAWAYVKMLRANRSEGINTGTNKKEEHNNDDDKDEEEAEAAAEKANAQPIALKQQPSEMALHESTADSQPPVPDSPLQSPSEPSNSLPRHAASPSAVQAWQFAGIELAPLRVADASAAVPAVSVASTAVLSSSSSSPSPVHRSSSVVAAAGSSRPWSPSGSAAAAMAPRARRRTDVQMLPSQETGRSAAPQMRQQQQQPQQQPQVLLGQEQETRAAAASAAALVTPELGGIVLEEQEDELRWE